MSQRNLFSVERKFCCSQEGSSDNVYNSASELRQTILLYTQRPFLPCAWHFVDINTPRFESEIALSKSMSMRVHERH